MERETIQLIGGPGDGAYVELTGCLPLNLYVQGVNGHQHLYVMDINDRSEPIYRHATVQWGAQV